MIAHAAAALAGDLLALLTPLELPRWLAAVAAALAVPCLLRGRLTVAMFLLAFAWTAVQVQAQRVATLRDDERVLAQVRVAGIPAHAGTGRSFDARARLVRRPGAPELNLRVSWRRGLPAELRAGETWQLALQLRAPRDVPNPGALDGLRVLWRDRIHARAEVLDSPLNLRLAAAGGVLTPARERIARRLLDGVADPAAGALLAALAVGYTGEVGRDQWQVYNATGITHLIAISGLHVTLFAVLVMAALRRVWRAWPWLALRVRRESFAALGGAAGGLGYALLAGWSVPTQRTACMLFAGLAWRTLARAGPLAAAPAAALLAVLALDPFAVLAAGFWLSFGAVAIILWHEGARLRTSDGVGAGLRLQLGITVLLAPATFANFGSVSLLGLLVNPLAIPLFSFVLVPLVLLLSALVLLGATPAVLAAPLWLADLVATHSSAWLARAAAVPAGLWQVDPPAWWYLCAAPACVLLLLPAGWRAKLLAAACLVPLLCPPARPPPGAWRALSLDTGGAPLVLLLTHRHALVFGTGDRFGTAGARVETLLLPAARVTGVRRLDALVAGRMDRDVAGGIGAVQALLPAARVIATAGAEGALPPGIEACVNAGRWQWDGVEFAARASPTDRGACVLEVGTGPTRAVFEPRVEPARSPRGARLLEAHPGEGVRTRRLPAGAGAWHRGRRPRAAPAPGQV